MSSRPDIENPQKVPERSAGAGSGGTGEISVITSPGVRLGARETNDSGWRLNRQISISVLVQLLLLASLIVGSWVNLQRQLDLLQHDVTYLCQCQKDFGRKLESLSAKSISYEYRLRGIEKHLLETDGSDKYVLP